MIVTAAGCKEVEVFPQRVQVEVNGGTTELEVSARYRKKKGGEILSDRITWHTDAAVEIHLTPSGREARLIIPSTAVGTIKVRAHAGSKSDELVIDLVQPVGDQVDAAEHQIPSVVMMVGDEGNCPSEHTVAFVRRGTLAERRDGCTTADVVEFTGYGPPKRGARMWVTGTEVYSFSTVQALAAIPVQVWLLHNVELFNQWGLNTTQEDALLADRAQFVDNAIHLANGVFRSSRVGVKVDRVGPPIRLQLSATNCSELLDEIAFDEEHPGGTPGVDVWRANAINVYVMDAFTGARGEYCRPVGGAAPRNVIRLQSPTALPSTLTHEFGHLWGLVVPWGVNGRHTGHTDKINAFAQDNVMWARLELSTTAARTRFSLGQVYRMHFDTRSAMHDGLTMDCGCDPFGTTCGRLSRDVRPLARAGGALGASVNACQAP